MHHSNLCAPARRRALRLRLERIREKITGKPDTRWISTSYVERQNLTLRMQLRRFARLSNAFSKRLSNLRAALALYFAYYDFCRVHSTLRVTPAMAADIAKEVWSIERLLPLDPKS